MSSSRSKVLVVVCIFFVLNAAGLLAIYFKQPHTSRAGKAKFAVVEAPHEVEISPEDSLVFRFSNAVDPKSLGAAGVTTKPSVEGETRLADTTTLVFTPKQPFERGQNYQVALPAVLCSMEGQPIEKPQEYEVSTAPLKVVGVSQVDFVPGEEFAIVLQFDLNGKISPSELIQQLSVTDDEGNAIDVYEQGGAAAESVQVRTSSIRRDRIRIAIGEKDVAGQVAAVLEPYTTELQISRQLKLIEAKAEWYDGIARVALRFNTPVDAAQAQDYITVSPEVDFGVIGEWDGLRLEGEFQAGERYTVTMRKGLPAGNGVSFVDKNIERIVWFSDVPGTLRFKFPGHYLSSDGSGLIPVLSTNVDSFKLKAWRVYPNNLIYQINSSGLYGNTQLSQPLAEETYSVAGKKNQETETVIDLRKVLKDFENGTIYLEIGYEVKRTATDTYYFYPNRYANTLVVFSDIGISCRVAGKSIMVWANSLKTSQPLADATVECYSYKNQSMGKATTDADGTASISLTKIDPEDRASFVLVKNGEDVSFHQLDYGFVNRAGIPDGREFLAEGYEAFVATERGMYRPGENVHIETIVRDSLRATPGQFPVDLVVYKPGRRKLDSFRQTLDAQGGASFEFIVPQYAMTGEYEACVVLPDATEIGVTRFIVSDFMPRRIEAGIEMDERRYSMDEEIPFTVFAKHLFGAPAKGLRVQCRLLWRSVPFIPENPELAKFAFGDSRIQTYDSSTTLADSVTNEEGRTQFSAWPEGAATPSPVEMQIHPVVLEEGNRPTPLFKSVMVDPYDFYLGAKRAFEGTPAPGTQMKFDVVAVNPDGKVKQEKVKCEVQLIRFTYSNIMKKVDGYYRYEWVREEIVEDTKVVTLTAGRGSVALKTPASGGHMMVVEAEGGCASTLEFYAYAPGEDSFPVEGPEKLSIELDKELYQAGDTAVVKINSTIKGRLLVTVEKERVLYHKTLSMTERSATVEIPVLADYLPNAYITATVVRPTGGGGAWAAHRTAGIKLLKMDATEQKLALTTNAPESVRPGENLSVTVNVAAEGAARPSARVFLAAVDEGVLQIDDFKTPDPFALFYGIRRLGIYETDMYDALLPELLKVGEASAPGGGEGESQMMRRLGTIDAARVRVVSLFSEPQFTDAEGNVTFDFTVPNYHGKLRVMALAADGALFGSNEKPVIVKSPLMLDCSFPRFLSPQDKCLVACTIRNKTGAAGTAKLAFQIDGPVACVSDLPLSIEMKKDEDVTQLVPFKALDECGKATITYTVTMGSETYEGELELPVRPASPVAHEFAAGEIAAPGKSTLTIPGDWYKGTESSVLVAAAMPWVKLSGCMTDLLDYPYGCVEQTVSRGIPLLYLPELVEMVQPGSVGTEEVEVLVNAVVLKLRSMQTYNGGLASWPGQTQQYEYGSAYAADFLIEAKKAGYDVSDDLLDPLLNYLSNCLAQRNVAEGEQWGLKAYEAFVLTRAGREPREWLVRLEEQRKELDPSARCHLASALYIAGIEQDAEDLLKLGVGAPKETRDLGGYLHSPLREKAIVLSTLLDVLPEEPSIPQRAFELARILTSDTVSLTTQENAWALMALAKYARQAAKPADFECTVTLSDGETRNFSSSESLTLEDIQGDKINVELKGEGTLYYYWNSSGVPVSGEAKAVTRGITLERALYDARSGSPADLANLKAGEVYYVVLTIHTDQAYQNIVIADLLPAGLEIEATDQAFTPDKKIERMALQYSEKRDDRVVLFADTWAAQKPASYCYVVRAVTPGTYVMPALEAECMYNTDIFFVGEASSVEIKQ